MPSPPPEDAAIVTAVFGMGLTEILLVGVVVLLLFSPKELPGVIKSVARFYGSIRRTAEDFRAQVMEADELREPLDEIREAYRGTKAELLQAQNAARRELAKAKMEARIAEQRLTRLATEEAKLDERAQQALTPASPANSGASAPRPATPAASPTASSAASSPAAPSSSSAPAGTAAAGRPGGDDPDARGAA